MDNKLVLDYTTRQIVLALATGLGAWGGFPSPPRQVSQLMQNEAVRWALLFVLVWQGGAGQDPQLAVLVTAVLYAVTQVLRRQLA